jgi:hypothetical protein
MASSAGREEFPVAGGRLAFAEVVGCVVGFYDLVAPDGPARHRLAAIEFETGAGVKPLEPPTNFFRLLAVPAYRRDDDLRNIAVKSRRGARVASSTTSALARDV